MADAPKNNKSRNRKKSGLKAVRVAARRRVMNLARTKAMKDIVKKFQRVIAAKGDAAKLLPAAYQAIDKALKSGVLKKNTAARMKSGLAKKLAVK
jgi:small subunit ribosomal protein S20